MTEAGPRWEMVGYAATPYFRGALAAREGEFAGHNSAVAVGGGARQSARRTRRVVGRNGENELGGAVGASFGREVGGPNRRRNADVGNGARARSATVGRAPMCPPNRCGRGGRVAGNLCDIAPNLPAGIGERLAALDGAARREAELKAAARSCKTATRCCGPMRARRAGFGSDDLITSRARRRAR